MRLYLAFAVLMLAFLAYTEAQNTETSFADRWARLREQMSAVTQDLAQKTKDTFAQIHDSDFAVRTRDFIQEQYEKVKTKFGEVTN